MVVAKTDGVECLARFISLKQYLVMLRKDPNDIPHACFYIVVVYVCIYIGLYRVIHSSEVEP